MRLNPANRKWVWSVLINFEGGAKRVNSPPRRGPASEQCLLTDYLVLWSIYAGMAATAQDVDIIREQERLFNFLKKYSLHQYYQKFLLKGVHRLSHLKDVCNDDASLDEIGLTRIERQRLKKKVKENVEWMGRIMVSPPPSLLES